jgi:hypothetical protein
MAKIWTPQPIEVYRSWVDAITSEASDKLNDWETNFVNDMDERLSLLRQLTEGQAEKLESIYAKYTS